MRHNNSFLDFLVFIIVETAKILFENQIWVITQPWFQNSEFLPISWIKWQFILIIRLVRHKPSTQTCTYTEPTKFAFKKWPHLWQISHHPAVCSTEKDQSNKSTAEICCCAAQWLKLFCCTYDHTPISNVTAAVLRLTAGGSHLLKGQSELRHAWSFPKRTVNEIICSVFKHCQIAMQANW